MSTEPTSEDFYGQLHEFTHAVWGRSNHVLFTDPDLNIEYIKLGRYLEAFQRLFPTAVVYSDKIFVRQEYRDALQALKGPRYHRGAYVTGQPGIGKTLFLIYVLVVSLGERRPVALDFPDDRPFYALFQESGFTTHSLDGMLPPINNLFNFMWALSDSNYQMRSPSAIFLSRPGKVRVIQATSPKEDRWKSWSKEARASCYIMDLWTLNEIEILANLLNLDVNRMTSLSKKWGCDPRTLLGFIEAGDTDIEIECAYRAEAPVAVKRSEDMLLAIEQNALSPSKFYFCRPSISRESEVDRTIPRPFVPTETICQVLGEALRESDNNVRLTFFRALSQHSETRSAAGYIYEHLFHSYFAAGRPVQCEWMQPKKRPNVIRLTDSSKVIPSTWRALTTGVPPFFWVAPKGAPGIDSALVLEKDIHVFQLTISSMHGSLIDGMKKYSLDKKVQQPRQLQTTGLVSYSSQRKRTVYPSHGLRCDPVVKGVQYMDFHPDVEADDGEGVQELAEQESSSKGKKRAIEEVERPEEAPKASTSGTWFKGLRTQKKT
ncbi:hypothetical protein F5887DRAFT_1182764 [Amanita rubescens]|nr:hypothetical protein F5887DRAFT_1182764 [Amanita rubescens]